MIPRYDVHDLMYVAPQHRLASRQRDDEGAELRQLLGAGSEILERVLLVGLEIVLPIRAERAAVVAVVRDLPRDPHRTSQQERLQQPRFLAPGVAGSRQVELSMGLVEAQGWSNRNLDLRNAAAVAVGMTRSLAVSLGVGLAVGGRGLRCGRVLTKQGFERNRS